MRSMADYDNDFALDPFGRQRMQHQTKDAPVYETPPILPPLMQEGARPVMSPTFPPLGPPPPQTMPMEQPGQFSHRPLGQPLGPQSMRRPMKPMSAQTPINGENYLAMLSQARQGLRFR
jgi:hypothetical protein